MTNRMPFIYQITMENDESSDVANFPIIFAQPILRDGTEKQREKNAKNKVQNSYRTISNFFEHIQIYSVFSHNLARLNQLILVWEKFLRQTHIKTAEITSYREKLKKR